MVVWGAVGKNGNGCDRLTVFIKNTIEISEHPFFKILILLTLNLYMNQNPMIRPIAGMNLDQLIDKPDILTRCSGK